MFIIALALAALASAPAPTPAPPTTAAAAPTTAAAVTSTTGVTTTVPSGPTTTIPIPAGYTPLIDDSHTIVLAVPDTWQDVNTAPIIPDEGSVPGTDQPSIVASPDIQEFYATFNVPGVSYFALPYVADPLTLISGYGLTGGCTTMEVKEYDDPVFVGVIQIGTDCGPLHMTWNMVVASPADHSFTAVLQAQSVDPEELKTLLLTFNVAA